MRAKQWGSKRGPGLLKQLYRLCLECACHGITSPAPSGPHLPLFRPLEHQRYICIMPTKDQLYREGGVRQRVR